jgi:hypothetical protein
MRRVGARLIAAGPGCGGAAAVRAALGAASAPGRAAARLRRCWTAARRIAARQRIAQGFPEKHSSLLCKTLFDLLHVIKEPVIVQSGGGARRINYSIRLITVRTLLYV